MPNVSTYIENIAFLKEALRLGKIDSDAVEAEIRMNKKKAVDSIHHYTISLKGGYYRTRLPKPDGKKHYPELKAKTDAELYQKLYSYYFDEHLDNPTLHELFEEWLTYKKDSYACREDTEPIDRVSKINTITRHRQHYNRYFKDTDFFSKRVKNITSDDLSSFSTRIISKYKLTHKEWTNVKTILKGMFEYAKKKKKYIVINPMDDLYLGPIRYRQPRQKAAKEAIFLKNDLACLKDYLYKEYSETKDLVCLAILFVIETGMRAGEVIPLQWTDIRPNAVSINKQCLLNKETRKPEVVPYTKGIRLRSPVLTFEAKLILLLALSHIDKKDGLIFHRNGDLISERALNYRLERFTSDVLKEGPCRRMHSVRFTYASILGSSNVPVATIQEQMGHSNQRMTEHYIKCFSDQNETAVMINNAMASVSHLSQ